MLLARRLFTSPLSRLLPLLLAALMTACASAPEIRIDKDPAIDLRAYRTFAFADPAVDGRSPHATIAGGRLYNVTREKLEEEGLVYRENDPDLRVNLVLNASQRLVSIEFVDTRRKVLVWQGVAERPADPATAKNPWQAIDVAVNEILAAFPDTVVR
jgi:hypothetical protein